MLPPPLDGDQNWLALSADPLPTEAALAWAPTPDCGAVVLFAGTVREHASGRHGVTELTYEAYEEQMTPRLADLAAEARRRWPEIGRLALWHRVGALELCEVSVVVVVATPHRTAAFEAARWCIDTAKATLPVWKRERWGDVADWGTDAQPVAEAGTVA